MFEVEELVLEFVGERVLDIDDADFGAFEIRAGTEDDPEIREGVDLLLFQGIREVNEGDAERFGEDSGVGIGG